jgi:hypothetical protein
MTPDPELRVVATAPGFYADVFRATGTVFSLVNALHFSQRWMRWAPGRAETTRETDARRERATPKYQPGGLLRR